MKGMHGRLPALLGLALICLLALPGCLPSHSLRLGFAAPVGGDRFSQEVRNGVQRAAAGKHADLVSRDNVSDPSVALDNAKKLLADHVDGVIEFGLNPEAAHLVCQQFDTTKVFLIVVDSTPGCGNEVYVGADNSQAGELAGTKLLEAAQQRWHGMVDRLILLDNQGAGAWQQRRLFAAARVVQTGLPNLAGDDRTVHLNGNGIFDDSRAAFASLLARLTTVHHILVAAFDDQSGLGVQRAAADLGRLDDVLVAGQGGAADGRAAICNAMQAFIGTVAYFPERYGDVALSLTDDIRAGHDISSTHYTHHVWLDRTSIARYYPGACG